MYLLGKNIKFNKRTPVHADGELWIVSYADMMTLLFGFFVILFAISKLDDDKFYSVGKELAETFRGDATEAKSSSEVGMHMQSRQMRALQLLVAMLNLGENVEEAVDKIEKKIQTAEDFSAAKKALLEELSSTNYEILSQLRGSTLDKEDKLEIVIPDTFLFKSGSAELLPDALKKIKEFARIISKIDALIGVEVIGHTDSLPPSKTSLYPSNWALSSARAGTVASELIKNGVSSRMMNVRGLASLQPLFPEYKPDGTLIKENLTKNRRVHIVIKKKKDE